MGPAKSPCLARRDTRQRATQNGVSLALSLVVDFCALGPASRRAECERGLVRWCSVCDRRLEWCEFTQMCRQWRGKVSQLVLVLLVLVLVLCGFGAVRCELPPWRPELSGLHRESRHRPLPPPPPRHHRPPSYHPGHRGLQPTPDDILALHPSHPLRFYSQRDGPPHGPHRGPPPHPAPRPPPHPAPSQHQPEFGPGPQHQSEFGPPHHTTSFAQAPLHHPEHQSEHQPEHEPDHGPEIQHGDHFHFRDFTLLHRQRHHETHQQDVHFERE